MALNRERMIAMASWWAGWCTDNEGTLPNLTTLASFLLDVKQQVAEQAAIIEAALKITDDMRSAGWHIGKTVPDLGEKLYRILSHTDGAGQ